MRALLVDEGIDRASLTAARALIAAGWEVGCAAPIPSLASRARGVRAWHQVPPPERDGAGFVQTIADVMQKGGYEIVFPAWEAAILCLSTVRASLPGVLPFAPHAALLQSLDKQAVTTLAAEVGLGSPRTEIATAEALMRWEGPVVLKPAAHHCSVRQFDSGLDAVAAAEEISRAGIVPLAQERVSGQLMALSAVACRDGHLVSVSQQRAEHIWPTPVGVTARGVTVAVDPELRERVAALIARLGWFGLFQIQFLVDRGTPRMIDFNGRWYGSMSLAVRAGANHPVTWARLAMDLPVQPSEARPGVRYQWLTRDLRASMRSEHPVIELGRAALLAPKATHSLWSLDQPLLAPRFLAEQALRAVRRRL